MMILNFTIPGVPTAKQSARFRIARYGEKQFIQSYQKKEIKEEERSIRLIIKEQLPKDFQIIKDEVIVLRLHYIFPPLSNFSKKKLNEIQQGKVIFKTTKPDIDSNLNKALFDAMEGIVFLNDAQVCSMNNMKKYYGFNPRIEIEITTTNQDCFKPVNLFEK